MGKNLIGHPDRAEANPPRRGRRDWPQRHRDTERRICFRTWGRGKEKDKLAAQEEQEFDEHGRAGCDNLRCEGLLENLR
jgi:hypothetical protein